MKLALLQVSSERATSGGLPECLNTWIITRGAVLDWDQLRDTLEKSGGELQACLLSGSQRERLQELAANWPSDLPAPRVIQSALELPIELKVDLPEKVGVDRVLNAVAVNQIRSVGVPAIIIDSGTAITIDAISSAGAFLGGAILPGYELEAHSLHDYTSLLPLIPMEDIIGEIPVVVGRNTRDALRSGLIWGQVGAVKEILSRMTASLQSEGELPPQFFLTGGAAPLLEPHLQIHFRKLPQLTLQGLGCLVEAS